MHTELKGIRLGVIATLLFRKSDLSSSKKIKPHDILIIRVNVNTVAVRKTHMGVPSNDV